MFTGLGGNPGALSRHWSRSPRTRRHRGKAVLKASHIAKVSDQLSAIIEAQYLSVRPIASIQLGKTFRGDGQHTEKPMRMPAGIAKRAHDLLLVDAGRLCHRLRNPVQRDVEAGKALRAHRQGAEKAMHRECGIQEEAHDRGGLPARRCHTSHHGGQRSGEVNAGDTSLGREIPMDTGLRVAVTADELALLVEAQDQGVGHEDVVDRDINLVTL